MKSSSTFFKYAVGAAGVVALVALGPIGGAFAVVLLLTYLILLYRESSTKKQVDVSTLDSISFRCAAPNDIDKIVELDRASFDASEIIDSNTFSEWHEKNSRIFYCLFSEEKLIGYFAILPLTPDALTRFIAGEINERHFESSDILSARQATISCSDPYFFSIAVLERYRHSANSLYLFVRLAEVLQQLHNGNRLRKIYATAATGDGRRLIKRLKFKLVQRAEHRADSHDLYVKDVSNIKDFCKYLPSKIAG